MGPLLPLNKNLNSMDFKKKKNSSKQGVKFTYIAPTKVAISNISFNLMTLTRVTTIFEHQNYFES